MVLPEAEEQSSIALIDHESLEPRCSLLRRSPLALSPENAGFAGEGGIDGPDSISGEINGHDALNAVMSEPLEAKEGENNGWGFWRFAD